jgi:hypothetical protein
MACGFSNAVGKERGRDDEESSGTLGLDFWKPYQRASTNWHMDGKA